jgi:hypothetical protein
LHHDHGVLRIDLAEMAHQSHKGALVRLERRAAVWARHVVRLAVPGHHPRETLRIRLDPFGHVAWAGVLPGAEPQQDQSDVVLACLRNQHIDPGKVELSLHRLDLLPGDGNLERVGMKRADRRPDFGQHGRVVAAVVRLPAQDQERRAVDQQGMTPILLDEPRKSLWLRQQRCCQAQREQRQNALEQSHFTSRKTRWRARAPQTRRVLRQ